MNIEKERFEAWLFSQPTDRTFRYTDASGCAIASFLKETTNIKTPSVNTWSFSDLSLHLTPDYRAFPIPDWLDNYGRTGVVRNGFFTVADMQKRFLELFPEQPIEDSFTHQAEQILKNV